MIPAMDSLMAALPRWFARPGNRVCELLAICWLLGGLPVWAGDSDYVPKAGEFAPQGAGNYLAGELISVDHVNRRGAIRFVGDNDDGRYHSAPSHRFAMLPYGSIKYHGAPAELRDIPLGTVLHGYFTLPPAGDTAIKAPNPPNSKFSSKYTHALSLEDDFSFYQRQGRAWKIIAVDIPKGELKVSQTGPVGTDGLRDEQVFLFDASTRIWQGQRFAEPKELAAGQEVQLNLTWAPDWKNGQFQIADLWIDKESRGAATERQRQIHIRFQRHHWLAGWIDKVEHQTGGKGVVTVTLFGGADPSLYQQAKQQAQPGGGAALAAGEWTLRTWWQEHDHKWGAVLECKEIADPLPGSSGLKFRVQIAELLEGFRPGRIVRFRPNGFPNSKLPPEERVQDIEDLLKDAQ